jgi:hypothetical protein
MEDSDWPLFGAIRLFDTSRGRMGVSFSEREVLPWSEGMWLSPASAIRFDTKTTTLADALERAGLPRTEAESLARTARDEWEAAVAKVRPVSQRRSLRPRIPFFATVATVSALWLLGMREIVMRAWRTVS